MVFAHAVGEKAIRKIVCLDYILSNVRLLRMKRKNTLDWAYFFLPSVLLVCLFVNPCMLISLYRSTLCDACRLNVLCICYFFLVFFLQRNERNGITSLTWVVGGKYTKKNITISTNRKSLSISVFISMFAQFLWFPRLLFCKPLLDWIFMFVYLSTENV